MTREAHKVERLRNLLSDLEAEQRVAAERIEALTEELEEMGVDTDDPETTIADIEDKIQTNEKKRRKYIQRATAILDRYDNSRRS